MGARMEGVAGLTGLQQEIRGRPWSTDHLFRFPWPETLTLDDLNEAHMDFEIMAEKLRDHPNEMLEIHAAFQEQDFRKAVEHAASIGLTEAEFKKRGGGCWYMYFFWGILFAYSWYGPPRPPGPVGTGPGTRPYW